MLIAKTDWKIGYTARHLIVTVAWQEPSKDFINVARFNMFQIDLAIVDDARFRNRYYLHSCLIATNNNGRTCRTKANGRFNAKPNHV